jgi:hypothetical protein
MYRIIFLLLITSASFGQVLQETNGSRADNRNVFKLGFRLPQVCWVTGNPNLLNYSAFMSKGAMVYDTCAGKIKRWSGSAWISVQDSTAGGGDTTGLGALYIRNTTTQEDKRFNVRAGRLDSLIASGSGGGRILSNGGSIAAEWGQGGGTNFDFHGFAGYNLNRASSYTVRSFTDMNFVDSSVGLRLRITDTAGLRAKEVFSFAKNAGRDSAILTLFDGTRLAVRDSVGGGGGVTTVGTFQLGSTANAASISGSNIYMHKVSATNPGMLSTGTDTIAGAKTFSSAPTFSSMTATRIPYFGTGGLVSNSANLLWDNTNSRLTVGTGNTVSANLAIESTTADAYMVTRTTATASQAGIFVFNDQATATAGGSFNLYGSAWASAFARNQVAFGSRQGLLFFSNNALLTGGTSPIDFYPGGGLESQRFVRMKNFGMAMNSAGTTADPVASAILDMNSTTKGFLPPRMTTGQRNAIASPASSLVVANTSLQNGLNFYNGTAWVGANQQVGNEAITGNKTITATTGTHLHMIDATSGNVTITLPTMAAGYLGVEYQFIRTDGSANTVTIQRAASNTINNAATSFTIAQFERCFNVIGVNNSNTFTWHAGNLQIIKL